MHVQYDADGSGEIDLDEFSQMVRKMLTQSCKDNVYSSAGCGRTQTSTSKLRTTQAAGQLQRWWQNR